VLEGGWERLERVWGGGWRAQGQGSEHAFEAWLAWNPSHYLLQGLLLEQERGSGGGEWGVQEWESGR